MEITDKQKAYIREHLNDRPRTQAAKRGGLSYNTFLFYVHKFGGDTIPRGPHKEKWKIIAENYGHMTGKEIDKKYGFSKGYSNYVARKILKIKHGEAALQKIADLHADNINKAREKYSDEYRRKRWKISRRMEELRILSGLPPKKKFLFAALPMRVYRACYRLINIHGYIKSTDPYTLLYDSTTRRRPLTGGKRCWAEDYYTETYGIKFMEDVEDRVQTESEEAEVDD